MNNPIFSLHKKQEARTAKIMKVFAVKDPKDAEDPDKPDEEEKLEETEFLLLIRLSLLLFNTKWFKAYK